MLQGKSKQSAKMSFLSQKCYSYISLKKPKTNKVEPTKKNKPIKYSHLDKNDIKRLEEKIKHLFLPLQYNWLFKWLFFTGIYRVKIAVFILFKISFLSIWLGSSK